MFLSSNLVAVLGTLLLLAAVASAQNQPTTYIYDAYVDNQTTVNTCSAGENVNLNGTIRFSYQVTSDASGNHFAIKAASNVTGVGQTTGTNYAAAESNEYDANTPDSSKEMTVQLSSDLSSQGATPGMTLVQDLHVIVDTNGSITAEVVSNNTSCGGAN
jgi:hypothetical protein